MKTGGSWISVRVVGSPLILPVGFCRWYPREAVFANTKGIWYFSANSSTYPAGRDDKSQNCGNKLNQKSRYFKVMLNDSEIKLKYLLFPLRCHCKFDDRRRASDWRPSWWCRTADEPSRSYLWLLWHGRLLLFGSLIIVLRNLSDSAPEG